MKTMTVRELANDLKVACKIADMNPAKDTLEAVVGKFRERNLRHLLLFIEGGGILCLCADPEMSRRIYSAIKAIDKELDAEEEALAS